MGMVLSFTRATPAELDRAFEDPEWAEELLEDEDRSYCYLDKAWVGIQFLLAEAGVDVDLYEDGDPIDEECTLFGWHDEMVARSAKALGAMPVEELAGHYDPKKMSEKDVYPNRHLWDDDDRDYLLVHYKDLVEFFQETAASGGALIRSFSF